MVPAQCDTYLVPAPTQNAESNDFSASASPKDVCQTTVNKNSSMQDFKDENTLDETDKSSIVQNEETKVGLFGSTNKFACSSVNQQVIKQKERSNVCFVAELESNKNADSDSFRQEKICQDNFSVSESHAKILSESTTSEKYVDHTTIKVNREISNGVAQEAITLPKEELAKNNVSKHKVKAVQCSEDAVNKLDNKEKPTKFHYIDQTDDSPETLKLQPPVDSALCSELRTLEINTFQPELIMKSADYSATYSCSASQEKLFAVNEINKDDHFYETKQPWVGKSDNEDYCTFSQT